MGRKAHRLFEIKRQVSDQRHLADQKDRRTETRRQKSPHIEWLRRLRPAAQMGWIIFHVIGGLAPERRKDKGENKIADPQSQEGAAPSNQQNQRRCQQRGEKSSRRHASLLDPHRGRALVAMKPRHHAFRRGGIEKRITKPTKKKTPECPGK